MPPGPDALNTDSSLAVGTLVRVRQRTWLVEGVHVAAGRSPVVSLSCVDDDAQGQELDVVWDAEVDARPLPPGRSPLSPNARPDDPRVFAAYLLALRWGCVTSTDPQLFQAPLRAGIVPKSYQLAPLAKALALPRVNLFIADDVGLGKTIEAGLVLQELLLRHRVQRVVVACPSSVVLQWRDEIDQRFGLKLPIFDRAYIQARRRERGFGVNAWTTHRHFIISHTLLRDEDYLVGLRDWLGAFSPGSLFILDEAHVAAPASQSRYAIDSQTTRAIRDVARRFEHRLFLSATPHNGHSSSFAALLEILDPQRFTRGVPVAPKMLEPVMVRRLKGELRARVSGIPRRDSIQLDLAGLPADTPELLLAERLAEYSEVLHARLAGADTKTRAAGTLVASALQKRLLSSVEAFAHTLAVHRRGTAGAIEGPDDDADEDAAVARASRSAASAGKPEPNRGGALLREMTELADRARDLPDAKLRHLLGWIRENQCPAGKWGPRRVLVFTEYVATLQYLARHLEAALTATDRSDERVMLLHGSTPEEEREVVKDAFNDAAHPVRILLATDAAREGINLQAQCADLFHFDLPWNPARIEQRNGRIDRTLQPEPVVRCHYYVYRDRAEDAVLEALVKKTERIHAELGSLSDVIDRRLTASLSAGIARRRAAELAREIQGPDPEVTEERARAAQEELEAVRDREVGKELDSLERLYQKARDHLGLGDTERAATQLRDVVDLGLSLAGHPPLTPRKAPAGSYDVPPMDELAPGDATWREILDGLRPPRPRGVLEWEWRAKHRPRPVSFQPATTLRSETVQLHLQHRLTQRCLAPFRSQSFGEDRLSRLTIGIDTSSSRKRVLALGRLSLYGAGASRLHEELLVVASYWSAGVDTARLEPFVTAEAGESALQALLQALSRPDPPALPPRVVAELVAAAPRDEETLWKRLREKAMARTVWAEEKLRRRAEVESDEMRRILEVQRRALDAELRRREGDAARQRPMDFAPDEKEQWEQYEADTRHIRKRRPDLDRELQTEPARILDQYRVIHHRLERVGLVYLWPSTT